MKTGLVSYGTHFFYTSRPEIEIYGRRWLICQPGAVRFVCLMPCLIQEGVFWLIYSELHKSESQLWFSTKKKAAEIFLDFTAMWT